MKIQPYQCDAAGNGNRGIALDVELSLAGLKVSKEKKKKKKTNC